MLQIRSPGSYGKGITGIGKRVSTQLQPIIEGHKTDSEVNCQTLADEIKFKEEVYILRLKKHTIKHRALVDQNNQQNTRLGGVGEIPIIIISHGIIVTRHLDKVFITLHCQETRAVFTCG